MSDLPESWADLFDRFAQALGGRGGRPEGLFYLEAETWFRELVQVVHGVESLRDLDRPTRARTFQRATATLLALYEQGDLAFTVGTRDLIRRSFARTWDGVVLDGPAWRIDPTEHDRLPYSEWAKGDEFGAPPTVRAAMVA